MHGLGERSCDFRPMNSLWHASFPTARKPEQMFRRAIEAKYRPIDSKSLRSSERRVSTDVRVGREIAGRQGDLHAYCKEIAEPNQIAAAAAEAALDETRRSINGSENGLVD